MKRTTKMVNIMLISLCLFILFVTVFIGFNFKRIKEENIKSQKDFLQQTTEYIEMTLQTAISNKQLLLEKVTPIFINEKHIEHPDTKVERTLKDFFVNNPENPNLLLLNSDFSLKEAYSWSKTESALHSKNVKTSQVYLDSDPSFIKKALIPNKSNISQSYFIKNTAYINLYQPMFKADKLVGYLLVPLNLNILYDTLFLESDASLYKGYPMIKNQEMLVIMHPSRQQIGLDIVDDRKKIFPDLNYTDLKKLEKYQQTHAEGTCVYDSYWWDDKDPISVSKVAAFKWITIGLDRWIIAVNADINERNQTLYIFTITLIIILISLLIVTCFFYRILKNTRSKEALEQENIALLNEQRQQTIIHTLELQLHQQNKLETIGLLTSSIAHDINNFLTPIIGNTELLIDEYADHSFLVADLLEILEGAKNGQRLTADVLRFSKNNVSVDESRDLSQVVNQVVETIKKIIPQHILLLEEIEETTENVRFDSLDIQTIIYNLVTNAYFELKEQRTNATIKVALYPTPDCLKKRINQSHSQMVATIAYLTLEVSDNGKGIPEKNIEKIFEPFFTTKAANEGTGLGLFTVKSIVDKYNWFLLLDSSESKGTSFYITLPVKD